MTAPCCSGESPSEEDLVEALADLAHQQWAEWMRYLFSRCESVYGSGKVMIPRWAVERWRRQVDASYADLPEREKESDRKEARRVVELLRKRGVL